MPEWPARMSQRRPALGTPLLMDMLLLNLPPRTAHTHELHTQPSHKSQAFCFPLPPWEQVRARLAHTSVLMPPHAHNLRQTSSFSQPRTQVLHPSTRARCCWCANNAPPDNARQIRSPHLRGAPCRGAMLTISSRQPAGARPYMQPAMRASALYVSCCH